jgi:hypothetical protein
MIKVNLELGVLIYMLLPVSFILFFLLLFGREQGINIGELNKILTQECSICLHVYRIRKDKQFFQCPVCGSYNKI